MHIITKTISSEFIFQNKFLPLNLKEDVLHGSYVSEVVFYVYIFPMLRFGKNIGYVGIVAQGD